MSEWLGSFILTQALEMPIYALALRGRPLGPRLAIAFGASAITHPVVWFVMPSLIPGSYWTMAIVAELFAVTIEAIYLRLCGLRQALLWSIVANGVSAGVGFLLSHLLGW